MIPEPPGEELPPNLKTQMKRQTEVAEKMKAKGVLAP